MFGVEPDLWQADALNAFASNDIEKQRISMQACAGPGKSAVLSWIAWNFLLCYNEPGYHPKGAAISMTHTNLMDNLWAEIYHWMNKNEFLKQNFKWTKDRLSAKDHAETWYISARSFSKSANKEEQGRALSGLHAKYVLFLIDEGGSVPPAVGKTAEQALTNCEFGKICMAGNPTSHDGFLYEASKDPNWYKIKITGDPDDPKRSPRIDIEWARKMIEKEGRDDPWVQSMILGRFPDQAINTLLTDIDFDKAEERACQKAEYEKFEKILGVDAARHGDDSSVIYPRQGLVAFQPKEIRKADGPTLGNAVLGAMNKWKDVDKINIDGTGGYGSSCYDYLSGLNTLGIHEIGFASSAMNAEKFFNRRAEMYWTAAQWIKKKGSLIANKKLREEMTNTSYYFVGDRIKIESKDQIKLKLKRSPDFADGFALTFAFQDQVKQKEQDQYNELDLYTGSTVVLNEDYDPLGRRGKSRR